MNVANVIVVLGKWISDFLMEYSNFDSNLACLWVLVPVRIYDGVSLRCNSILSLILMIYQCSSWKTFGSIVCSVPHIFSCLPLILLRLCPTCDNFWVCLNAIDSLAGNVFGSEWIYSNSPPLGAGFEATNEFWV